MAEIGKQLLAPESGWARYDGADSNIELVGSGWNLQSNVNYYKSTQNYNNIKGDCARFNFIGTKLRVIAMMGTNNAKDVVIKIDGEVKGSFDTYTSLVNGIYQALVYEITVLSNKEHYVELTNNTTDYFRFDAIDIDDSGTLKPYGFGFLQYGTILSTNRTIYSNVIMENDDIKIEVKAPTLEKNLTEEIVATESASEDGKLFETDYFDLQKYKSVSGLELL